MRRLVSLAVACLILGGCGKVAEYSAPKKSVTAVRTPAAVKADALFWSTFHGGRYDQIQPALEAETAAYLADPHDAVSAAHVGWLHIWRLAERARHETVPATITDDGLLAHRYFEEASAMVPREARYRGFLASATLVDGGINQDETLKRRGYFTLLDAVKAWPEFNLFTAGYSLSDQPAGSKLFAQALDWQWQDLDACVGERFDRKNPDLAKYMHLETRTGPKRACWNSWIAPHNFEGFFLNMGDMLVKAGDWQTAQKIYASARLSSTYSQWPFREVLEGRIRDAQGNVAAFKAPAPGGGGKSMMFDSSFSCMACHQQ
jgi:uncharacterized protein YceK